MHVAGRSQNTDRPPKQAATIHGEGFKAGFSKRPVNQIEGSRTHKVRFFLFWFCYHCRRACVEGCHAQHGVGDQHLCRTWAMAATMRIACWLVGNREEEEL